MSPVSQCTPVQAPIIPSQVFFEVEFWGSLPWKSWVAVAGADTSRADGYIASLCKGWHAGVNRSQGSESQGLLPSAQCPALTSGFSPRVREGGSPLRSQADRFLVVRFTVSRTSGSVCFVSQLEGVLTVGQAQQQEPLCVHIQLTRRPCCPHKENNSGTQKTSPYWPRTFTPGPPDSCIWM